MQQLLSMTRCRKRRILPSVGLEKTRMQLANNNHSNRASIRMQFSRGLTTPHSHNTMQYQITIYVSSECPRHLRFEKKGGKRGFSLSGARISAKEALHSDAWKLNKGQAQHAVSEGANGNERSDMFGRTLLPPGPEAGRDPARVEVRTALQRIHKKTILELTT